MWSDTSILVCSSSSFLSDRSEEQRPCSCAELDSVPRQKSDSGAAPTTRSLMREQPGSRVQGEGLNRARNELVRHVLCPVSRTAFLVARNAVGNGLGFEMSDHTLDPRAYRNRDPFALDTKFFLARASPRCLYSDPRLSLYCFERRHWTSGFITGASS